MFQYVLTDQAGFLRIGYLKAESRTEAESQLTRAGISHLESLTVLETGKEPQGARYMYPFEGKQGDTTLRGTVEGETMISALEVLTLAFTGTIVFIAERPPRHEEDKRLFAVQTMALLSSMAPKPQSISAPEGKPRDGVATVLDRQFLQLLDQIVTQTKELLKERQYAEEVQEMHRFIFTLEQQADITLKEKYDALSSILRELSYIEDGLDPSPLKKDLRVQIDAVVATLKKVEKSMVRTAFHMDNLRIHQEGEGSAVIVASVTPQEQALSRYASRRRLVREILQEMQRQARSSATEEGHPSEEHSTHAHESEPLGHLLRQEFPMILEWFVGFSLTIIILGQMVSAMDPAPTLAGFPLAEYLRPFAWQPIFLKTTLLALVLLAALRVQAVFKRPSIIQWFANILFLLLAAIFSLGL